MTQLLTPKEAAHVLKISERQLRRLKIKRVYVGQSPRYRVDVLDAWIAKREKMGKAA